MWSLDLLNYLPLHKLTAIFTSDGKKLYVIQENQWGYRKDLPTNSLLLYLTETWKANIDKGKVVGVIFIDFRKPLDCVDHEILGFKMQGCENSGNLLV